eukprot:644572-Pleurochrysis_carterae.AAC.5
MIIHVWRVGSGIAGCPFPIGGFVAATQSNVESMSAAERGEISQLGRNAGSDQQCCELLRRSPQGALGKGQARTLVCVSEGHDVGQDPNGSVVRVD